MAGLRAARHRQVPKTPGINRPMLRSIRQWHITYGVAQGIEVGRDGALVGGYNWGCFWGRVLLGVHFQSSAQTPPKWPLFYLARLSSKNNQSSLNDCKCRPIIWRLGARRSHERFLDPRQSHEASTPELGCGDQALL